MSDPVAVRREDEIRQLVPQWRERERRLCRRSDVAESTGNSIYARALAGQAEQAAQCADELESALASLSESAPQKDRETSEAPFDTPILGYYEDLDQWLTVERDSRRAGKFNEWRVSGIGEVYGVEPPTVWHTLPACPKPPQEAKHG